MDTVRRKIIHWLGGGLLGIIIVFFTSMVKRSIMLFKAQAKPRRLSLDIAQGISFHQDIIINRRGDKYLVISARCTHLGCIIDTIKDGKLLCPCHGSSYSPEGQVLRGPAKRNLGLLPHRIDKKENVLIVETTS